MKLIVGLGNPGREYINTRHNVGFMVIDVYAKKHNVVIEKNKHDGLYGEFSLDGEKVILLKPQLYMNLSGDVIAKYIKFYKLDMKDVLIISDDLDMSCGKIKLRFKGSSGGHNGLKNIESNLKSNVYNRLKVGISNNKLIDTKNYVLGKFSNDDLGIINDSLSKITSIIDDFMVMDFVNLMNKYN